MREITLSIFALLLISNVTFGQKDTSNHNSLYIELDGAGGHYALNYEREIPIYKNFGINTAIGFSPSLLNRAIFSPRLPFQLKLYVKKAHHMIDLGAALTPYIGDYLIEDAFSENFRRREYAVFGQFGYRYSIKDKFFAGIAFTPLLLDNFILYEDRYLNNFSNTSLRWGALRIGFKF